MSNNIRYLPIARCCDCGYCSLVWTCNASDSKKIENYGNPIPEWCPLPSDKVIAGNGDGVEAVAEDSKNIKNAEAISNE